MKSNEGVIKIEQISKEIRRYRREKGITLKELSERTELSVSFLSQVERGISSMTITSLKKIADALDVSMKDLISVDEKPSFVKKKDNQMMLRIEKSFIRHIRLSGKFDNRKLESFLLTMEPNFFEDEEVAHEGEEFHYVLNGTALFSINGETYELNEGETIHYPSTLPHKLSNPANIELKILSVITPTIF